MRSACTAPDKLAGHILIFHYLLRCHPTGRHPRCHFGAFTAHLGCSCCPGEQPGQPRRFLGGDDCQPVISCTAPSVFRDNHGLLGEPSIPSGIAGYRAGTSPEEQRMPERRVTAPIWPRARRGLVPTAAQCLRQRSPRPRRRVLCHAKTCQFRPFLGVGLRRYIGRARQEAAASQFLRRVTEIRCACITCSSLTQTVCYSAS